MDNNVGLSTLYNPDSETKSTIHYPTVSKKEGELNK